MNNLIGILRIIRYKNLILIAMIQFFLEYYILEPSSQIQNYLNFSLLVTITILIASSGYILNNIFDIESDIINKKKVIISNYISTKKAMFSYYLINSIAIILSLILCIKIQKIHLSLLFIICIYLLWLYSKKYKHTLLVGNITVAILISLSFINVWLFKESTSSAKALNIILVYALFSFLINFVRELIKDMEDIKGDLTNNSKNIPIIYGNEVSKKIAISLLSFLILIICYSHLENYNHKYWIITKISTLYSIFIILSITYSIILIYQSKKEKDFYKISQVLKIIMLLGIMSIPIFKYY